MSYTPTTWTTGDTITATKLNKIEQGIANAGGGGVASVWLSATGFAASSKTYGHIVTAYRDDNTWIVCDDNESSWIILYGYATPTYRVVNVMVPSDTDVAVFLLDMIKDDKNISGGVSSTAETLYYSWGSIVEGNAYKITGDGSFEFVAD